MSRSAEPLKAGSVVVIHVILEGVRQLAALNRSGMLFTAATLAIADAIGCFSAVLRAGGVVVGGVVFKGVAQRIYNLLLDDRLTAAFARTMAAFG